MCSQLAKSAIKSIIYIFILFVYIFFPFRQQKRRVRIQFSLNIFLTFCARVRSNLEFFFSVLLMCAAHVLRIQKLTIHEITNISVLYIKKATTFARIHPLFPIPSNTPTHMDRSLRATKRFREMNSPATVYILNIYSNMFGDKHFESSI